LDATVDETLEQAKAVINLLARAERYRSGPNSVGVGKVIVTIYRWCIPPALVSMVVTLSIGIAMGRTLTREGHPILYWGTEVLSIGALGTCGFILVSVLTLLWKRRADLTENEAHHLRSGYLLHESQVGALASHPLAVLQSVSRYFEQRPLSGRGVHMAFVGKSELTFATFAVVLTVIKQLYDMHAFGLQASNGDVLFFVWTSLMTLLYISVMVRWFRKKEDYQRGLLMDAIALLTNRDGITMV